MNYGKPKRPRSRRSDAFQFHMNAHPFCEACGIVESRDAHHIITRQSGGAEESYNCLALCVVCHSVFHKIGRKAFAFRYQHLSAKIQEACQRQGRKW